MPIDPAMVATASRGPRGTDLRRGDDPACGLFDDADEGIYVPLGRALPDLLSLSLSELRIAVRVEEVLHRRRRRTAARGGVGSRRPGRAALGIKCMNAMAIERDHKAPTRNRSSRASRIRS
jgi:hypothetical protein